MDKQLTVLRLFCSSGRHAAVNEFGKSLLVVEAQVGEPRHESLIFLFKISNFSCQLSSFAQQILLLPICRQQKANIIAKL